jgi:hypothetical protein
MPPLALSRRRDVRILASVSQKAIAPARLGNQQAAAAATFGTAPPQTPPPPRRHTISSYFLRNSGLWNFGYCLEGANHLRVLVSSLNLLDGLDGILHHILHYMRSFEACPMILQRHACSLCCSLNARQLQKYTNSVAVSPQANYTD